MRYRILFALAGPLILWAGYFSAIYGLQAVGCRAGWDVMMLGGISLLRLTTIVAFVMAVSVSALLYLPHRKVEVGGETLLPIARYVALAGLASTILVFAGVFWLQLC